MPNAIFRQLAAIACLAVGLAFAPVGGLPATAGHSAEFSRPAEAPSIVGDWVLVAPTPAWFVYTAFTSCPSGTPCIGFGAQPPSSVWLYALEVDNHYAVGLTTRLSETIVPDGAETSSPFGVSDDCGGSIDYYKSCVVTVSYTVAPTSTCDTATLHLTADDVPAPNTLDVLLQGCNASPATPTATATPVPPTATDASATWQTATAQAAQTAAAQQTATAQAEAQEVADQRTATALAQATQMAIAQQTAATQQTVTAQQTVAAAQTADAGRPPATPVPPTATPAAPTSLPSTPVAASRTPTPHPLIARRKATATATPARRLALALRPDRASVASGKTLLVRVRTAPRARVDLTLSVTATRTRHVGHGKARKLVRRTVVVYRVSRHGLAGKRGLLALRLHIVYRPPRPTVARLAATARLGRAMGTRTIRVTITPLRHQSQAAN